MYRFCVWHLGRLGENCAFLIFEHIFLKLATKKMLSWMQGWYDFLRFSVWMVTWVWRVMCLKVLLSASCNGKMVWISGGRRDSPTCRIQALFAYDVWVNFWFFNIPPLHFLSQLLLIQILAYLVTWPLGCFVTTTTCCYGGCGILLCSQVLCGTLRDLVQYLKSRWHSPCILFFF